MPTIPQHFHNTNTTKTTSTTTQTTDTNSSTKTPTQTYLHKTTTYHSCWWQWHARNSSTPPTLPQQNIKTSTNIATLPQQQLMILVDDSDMQGSPSKWVSLVQVHATHYQTFIYLYCYLLIYLYCFLFLFIYLLLFWYLIICI